MLKFVLRLLNRGGGREGTRERMPEYCVTGGTGLIASYLVKTLLHKGCTVRATVRDPEDMEKVNFLLEMNGAKERLRLFKADLMVDGSFDQAIAGVDGVFHVASPVLSPHDGQTAQALIVEPCVKGTLNVLNSSSKAGTVKRVVLSSSCYAIQHREDIRRICPLNESHWSDLEYCKSENLWYAYAKTLAEKAAWEVAKERGLDLVVVNPSFVVGPLLSPQPSSTLKFVLHLIKGISGGYQKRYVGFIHVEDTVDAHILAMEESRASGRLICSGSVAHWSDIISMLRAKYPQYPFESKPISQPGEEYQHSFDTTKIMNLGFPGFKSLAQMFDDCVQSFQDKGLL